MPLQQNGIGECVSVVYVDVCRAYIWEEHCVLGCLGVRLLVCRGVCVSTNVCLFMVVSIINICVTQRDFIQELKYPILSHM